MKCFLNQGCALFTRSGIRALALAVILACAVPAFAATSASYSLTDFEFPPRDEARINNLPGQVMPLAALNAYLTSTTRKVETAYSDEDRKLAESIIGRTSPAMYTQLGAMAGGLWLYADYPSAVILMGRAALLDPTPDNLNNYAALLVMIGGEHLALPILQRLNQDFPNNSTVLNNLGQAWFGLGDLPTAMTYLQAAVKLHPEHPQANVTKAVIESSNGAAAAAVESLDSAILAGYTRDKEAMIEALGEERRPRPRARQEQRLTEAALGLDKWMDAVPKFPRGHTELAMTRANWEAFYARVEADMIEIQTKLAAATAALLMPEPQRAGAKNRLRYNLAPQARYLARYYQSGVDSPAADDDYLTAKFERAFESSMRFTELKQEIDDRFADAPRDAKCAPLKVAVDEYLSTTNTILEDAFRTHMDYSLLQLKNRAYAAQFFASPAEMELEVLQVQVEFLLQLSIVRPDLDSPTTEVGEHGLCPVMFEPAKGGDLPEFEDLHCDRNVDFAIPLIGSAKMTCTGAEVHVDPLLLPFEAHVFENLKSGEYTAASVGIGIGPVKVSGSADFQAGTGTLEAGYSKTVGEGYLGPLPLEASANATVGVEITNTGFSDVKVSTGLEAKAGNSAGSVSVEAGARWGINAGGASEIKAGLGGAVSRL